MDKMKVQVQNEELHPYTCPIWKWPKNCIPLMTKWAAPLDLWHRVVLNPYKTCPNRTKWKSGPSRKMAQIMVPPPPAHCSRFHCLIFCARSCLSLGAQINEGLNNIAWADSPKWPLDKLVGDPNVWEEVEWSNPDPSIKRPKAVFFKPALFLF